MQESFVAKLFSIYNMNKLLLILFFLSVNGFAQQFFQKKDGTKITVADNSIHIEPGKKRIGYLLPDSKKEMHVSYKVLDFASYGDFFFKTFPVDKKDIGFFVLAAHNGKTLLTTKRTRIKSRGGFESTYTHYDVLVIDKSNNVLENLSFTDEKNDRNTADRAKVIPMIKNHFAACKNVVEKAALFESPASDDKNLTVLVLLNDPKNIKCNE